MQLFVATVVDDDLVARLTEAIDGRGAFRRFRSVLERNPAQFTRWHRFDADARLGHARSWVADQGYEARPVRHGDIAGNRSLAHTRVTVSGTDAQSSLVK